MATANSIPKRRWYQYSTRTLFLAMTLAGVGCSWWVHAQFCLRRAADYRLMASRPFFVGNFSGPLSIWDDYARDEQIRHQRFQTLEKHYEGLEKAYRHAAWFPWERLWIDETPLTGDAQ